MAASFVKGWCQKGAVCPDLTIYVYVCVCQHGVGPDCSRMREVTTGVGSCVSSISSTRGWLCVCSWRPGKQQPSCHGAARTTAGSVSGGHLPVQRSGMWAWQGPAVSVNPVAVWSSQCRTSSFVMQQYGSDAKHVTASECCCWCCVAQRWSLQRGPGSQAGRFFIQCFTGSQLWSLVGELLCSACCLLSS